MNPTNEQELRELYWRCDVSNYRTRSPIGENEFVSAIQSLIRTEKLKLLAEVRERVALDKEEMTLRYAIQTLQDTNKEFALENLQRQLDKNLAQQEEV